MHAYIAQWQQQQKYGTRSTMARASVFLQVQPSSLILLVVVLLILCSAATTTVGTAGGGGEGLRMRLTHVDDMEGTSYTDEERVRRAAVVSRERRASMRDGAGGGGDVAAVVHRATRQYIADYLIGEPPQRAEALIDTGSDLIWTQCGDICRRKSCVKQNLPYYNASSSSSFAPVPCGERLCAANGVHLCGLDGSCTFIASYGAGGVIGSLGRDAFVFQSGTARLGFGCVSFTQILPGSLNGASGLIGLGRGVLSLVSQTSAARFSYCLTPYLRSRGTSSHLFVGPSASLNGGGAVTTMPFVKNPKDYPYNIFYYLPLEGITVGKTKLAIPSTAFDLVQIAEGIWIGGVIIDTGSPFTAIADQAYSPLIAELTKQLNGSLVPAPADFPASLCVPLEKVKVVPALVFHFSGGADMPVPPTSYWAKVDKSTACMVIQDGGSDSVIGNFQQQDMHVLYDLRRRQLSFQPADCSKL